MDSQGHRIEFENDDIVLPLVFDNYRLFSLCEHIHYRMPTDFDTDAAVVLRDPARFKQRLISSFLARLPTGSPWRVRSSITAHIEIILSSRCPK